MSKDLREGDTAPAFFSSLFKVLAEAQFWVEYYTQVGDGIPRNDFYIAQLECGCWEEVALFYLASDYYFRFAMLSSSPEPILI